MDNPLRPIGRRQPSPCTATEAILERISDGVFTADVEGHWS